MYDFHSQRNDEQEATALPPPQPSPLSLHGAGSCLEENGISKENIGITHLGGG